MTVYLPSVLPEMIAVVIGTVAIFLVWFFPAVLLAVIKLAASPKFRARLAISNSKS